jgi:isopentenyl diphosphate isomerase/L-lactate dehydrogenase-like FMN-dependent dehydrogenase
MLRADRFAKTALNIADLRKQAQARLPRGLFEFLDRGSEDEISLRANRSALERLQLRPRVGLAVGQRSLATELLGRQLAAPLVIAPTGMGAMLWQDGEMALARAAAHMQVPFTVGTHSLTSVERLARIPNLNLWLQVYPLLKFSLVHSLMQRARDAGVRTLVVTLDQNVLPNREYFARTGFTFPIRPSVRLSLAALAHPRWTAGVVIPWLWRAPRFPNLVGENGTSLLHLQGVLDCLCDPAASWKTVDAIRRAWSGDLLIKGVLRADDARLALDHGANGIVVSNHGGRALDGAVAAIDALADIVDAVKGKLTILMDSGIRRGADVAKALALGADAAMIGRSTLYGVAAAGELGGRHALHLLMTELDRVIGLLGCNSPRDLGRDHLILPGQSPRSAHSSEPRLDVAEYGISS